MVDGLSSPILAAMLWMLGALAALAVGGGAARALLRASGTIRERGGRGDAPRDLVETVIEKVLDWFREGWRLQPARLRIVPPPKHPRSPRDR